ncbi:MAG: osmotically inducible protein OsmC [Bacteroidetes bacterium HGW-Bacteroidetes-21]|nr:MAG: osmotically inducible protein OsmC [Bacteroidetes bacterium HGW-Bacteroidetes-21]
MKTSKVTYLGELRTEAVHLASGNKIITDAPIDNEGKGEFFSPTDLAATSLASCMFTIMGISARNYGIKMEGATAEVTKVMGTNPRRIVEIIIDFHFPNQYTDKEKKILQLAVDNCPVGKSVDPLLKQTIHLNFDGDNA